MTKYATDMMTMAKKAKTTIEALQAQKRENDSDHFKKRITDEVHYENDTIITKAINETKTEFYEYMHIKRNSYLAAANQWDTLDAAKLTDDVKLLNSPIKLGEDDYTKLLEKYKDNRTMLRAITDSASANKVEFTVPSGGVLVSAEAKLAAFDDFSQSVTNGINDLSRGNGFTFAVLESMTDISSKDVALDV